MTSVAMSQQSIGDSFLFVDRRDAVQGDHNSSRQAGQASVSSLEPFFPHLAHPTSTGWYWTSQVVGAARRARDSRPDGKLYIDELLELLGLVDYQTCYPPQSPEQLEKLLKDVLSAPVSRLTANCVIYYLLLVSNEEAKAVQFARQSYLPNGYTLAVSAFAKLDAGDWQTGISHLTDSRLTPDFTHKTLALLGNCAPPDQRFRLVLRYSRLANVPLDSLNDVSLVVSALADSTSQFAAEDALALIRPWTDESGREQLVRSFLSSCLGDNHQNQPRAVHLKSLLTLPLRAEEDRILSAFCASPPMTLSKQQRELAAEWRLSKLVAESRPVEAIEFARRASLRADHPLVKAVQAALTEFEMVSLDLDESPEEEMQAEGQGNTSTIQQPGWAPQPVQDTAPPKSLADLHQTATPSKKVSASDLPLSASPFLRAGKNLSGPQGVPSPQKTVLRAMRETSLKPSSPASSQPDRLNLHAHRLASPASTASRSMREGSPLLASASVASPSQRQHFHASSSTNTTDIWSRQEQPPTSARKPTLSGFGSVRIPATPVRLDSLATETEEVEMDTDDFAARATRDPAIARTLEAASLSQSQSQSQSQSRSRSQDRDQPNASRKRDGSNGKGSQQTAYADKRRAVSKEPVDGRPTKASSAAGDSEDDEEEDEDTMGPGTPGAFPTSGSGRNGRRARTAARGQPTRRQAQVESKTKAKPVAQVKKANEGSSSAFETPAKIGTNKDRMTTAAVARSPPTSAVRRSSRLATPARATREDDGPTSTAKKGRSVTGTKATAGKRRAARSRSASVLAEEDDD